MSACSRWFAASIRPRAPEERVVGVVEARVEAQAAQAARAPARATRRAMSAPRRARRSGRARAGGTSAAAPDRRDGSWRKTQAPPGVDDTRRPAPAGRARRSRDRPGSKPPASAPGRSSSGTRSSPRAGRRARSARAPAPRCPRTRRSCRPGAGTTRGSRLSRAGAAAAPAGTAARTAPRVDASRVSSASKPGPHVLELGAAPVDAGNAGLEQQAALDQLARNAACSAMWAHRGTRATPRPPWRSAAARRSSGGSARWRPSGTPTACRADDARR